MAEASNFSRAALHLGVAQPIVTRKIRKLEEDLGVNLFIWTNRGCTLTQEGELLYSKAAGILMQLTYLKDEVSTSHDRISGSISVGVPIASGMLLAPHLMLAVAARWPLLRVELLETVSRNLLAGVLNCDISLALLYDPPVDADAIARPLLMERLHLIDPPRASHVSSKPGSFLRAWGETFMRKITSPGPCVCTTSPLSPARAGISQWCLAVLQRPQQACGVKPFVHNDQRIWRQLRPQAFGQCVPTGVVGIQAGIHQQTGSGIEQAGHAHQREGTLMVCVVALAAKVLTIFSRVGGAPDHTIERVAQASQTRGYRAGTLAAALAIA